MNNEINFFENKKYPKTRNLIPHNSRLNNYKSNRYFTIEDNTNLMKEALTKYRESQQKSENNEGTNKSQHSDTSTNDITNLLKAKQQQFNKNNTIKLDKNILFFAEPRAKIQQFHKMNPKVIDSITIDNLDNYNEIETIREKTNNNEKRNIIYKKSRINDYNRNIKLQKNVKNKKFDITIDMNDKTDSVINENEDDESETIYYESEYQKVERPTYENKNNNNINKLFDLNDINFDYLLIIEKLFNDLMKDIEINKMEKYINKLSIVKDFLFIFNDEEGFKIIDKIDSYISKNKNDNIFFILKEYLHQQLILFYTMIIIELIQKDKNNFFSGLHSLIFYFHQNFIIFLYIILTNIQESSNLNINIEIINNKNECIKMINENKTWLDKTDFKEYLLRNNKISKQTLINLLNQIKSYFQKNNKDIPYFQNNIYNNRNNQNNIIDLIINLFLSRIAEQKFHQLSFFIKELKSFPAINYLLELVNINKIPSIFNSNSNPEVYEFDTEDNKQIPNESENDSIEFNIEENITTQRELEQKISEPYLNPINPKYKYTLVLDLDETLVHYTTDNESAYIQIRPGTEDFLIDLSKYYEIVIFTAALQKYADLVINSIDPNRVISYRLYRQHTISIGNSNVKDLAKLGRDLRRVIIVDNCLENFALQSRNGLKIIDFEGNEFDDELDYLKEDLIKLVKMNITDVRDYLENIQIAMDQRAKFLRKIDFNFNNNFNNYRNEFNNEIVNYKYKDNNINLFRETIGKNQEFKNTNKQLQKEKEINRYSYNNEFEE